ncbi:hypothetical protein FACS1894219_10560 [Clostridia bacterium]|nr:hypothetical protein FACS1894219_10560 [Clostridia bacterium]
MPDEKFDRFGEAYEIDEDGRKIKKGLTIGKLLKYTLYLLIFALFAFIIVRIMLMGDPDKARDILNTPAIAEEMSAAQRESGDEAFTVQAINVREPFAVGDMMHLSDTVYLERAKTLQLTLRIKTEDFRESFTDEPTSGNFAFYLVATRDLKIGNPEPEAVTQEQTIHEFGRDRVFAESKYTYRVMSFPDVDIDYKNTKVEFFIVPVGEFLEETAIARFLIYDVNTPTDKKKIGDYKIFE